MDRVRQRLDRRDHDRVAGVDAQRVDVLHGADRDAGVVRVAHDLVFDLLPAHQAALDHDLVDGAEAQAGARPLPVGVLGLDDAAAGAAQGEGGPDDRGQADLGQGFAGGVVAGLVGLAFDDAAGRVGLADPVEQVAELLAVLGHLDRFQRRADEPDVVLLEHSGLGQGHGQVQGRLAAEPGQEPLRPLFGDDLLDRLHGQRLEVDGVRHLGVGHDRGRVRVDQDRPNALAPEGAAGLGAGVVELGRLADDHGPGTDDQRALGLGRALTQGRRDVAARWALGLRQRRLSHTKKPPAKLARWFPLQTTMDLLFRPLWTGTPASQDRPQRLAEGYHDGRGEDG